MNPIVVENIIHSRYQNEIEKLMLEDNNVFAWLYKVDLTYGNQRNDISKLPGLVHGFVQQGNPVCAFWELLKPLYFEILEKLAEQGIEVSRIINCRGLLQFPDGSGQETILNAHIDVIDVEHVIAVYYVNNSTGDTVIYDNQMPKARDKGIVFRATPKKGSVVLFPGDLYHAGSNPISGSRCVINISMQVKK
jgi:hypothetical protein